MYFGYKVRCMSETCVYRNECIRHNYSEDDDPEQTYADFTTICERNKTIIIDGIPNI